MQSSQLERPVHAHHKLAAAIFVGSLMVGASLILSAELMKPERYEYHPATNADSYIIYDRDTGRATSNPWNTKNPIANLTN